MSPGSCQGGLPVVVSCLPLFGECGVTGSGRCDYLEGFLVALLSSLEAASYFYLDVEVSIGLG